MVLRLIAEVFWVIRLRLRMGQSLEDGVLMEFDWRNIMRVIILVIKFGVCDMTIWASLNSMVLIAVVRIVDRVHTTLVIMLDLMSQLLSLGVVHRVHTAYVIASFAMDGPCMTIHMHVSVMNSSLGLPLMFHVKRCPAILQV